MKANLKSLVTLMALLLTGLVYAEPDKAGTATLTELKMDFSARAAALGGNFISIADDASCLYYNPAGMINVKNIDMIATHHMYYADVSQSFLGVVYPLVDIDAAVGLSGSFLNVGDMDETTPAQANGTGRTFNPQTFIIGGSYAQMLTTKFFVGGTLKYIHSNLAPEDKEIQNVKAISADAVTADIGTYYNTGWNSLVFGLSVRNFGTNVTYIKEESALPMLFVFGMGSTVYKDDVNKVSALLEVGHPSDAGEYVTVGAEYSFGDMFFVRAGRKIDGQEHWFTTSGKNEDSKYKASQDGTAYEMPESEFNWYGTSAGLGFKYNGFKIDYSYKNGADLGSTNMISIGYELK